MPIVQGLEWLWDALGQCLCPSRCAACDEPLTDGHATGQLCTACFALCEPCPIDASDLSTQAPRCRSSFVYEGPLSTALLRLKWQGRDDLARPLGLLLGPLLHDLMDQYDWLVPVPLHRERLRRRGYNQSTLLAREALRCQTGRPRLRLHVGLLTATRPTIAAHQLRRSSDFRGHSVASQSQHALSPRWQIDGLCWSMMSSQPAQPWRHVAKRSPRLGPPRSPRSRYCG